MIGELGLEAFEQLADREVDHLGEDDPGLQLVDVEQRVEHPRHGADRVAELADQLQGGLVRDPLLQHPLHQADGLQGLAQVVAGGGEELGFCQIGAFGIGLRGLERGLGLLALGDVVDRQQDLSLGPGLRPDITGFQQEPAPAPRRHIDLDLAVVDGAGVVSGLVQKVVQCGHIELMVVVFPEPRPQRVFRGGVERVVVRTAGRDDAQLVVEQDQRLAN